MASIAIDFNNVIILEANKGETWNGDNNYTDISPNVASFAEEPGLHEQ